MVWWAAEKWLDGKGRLAGRSLRRGLVGRSDEEIAARLGNGGHRRDRWARPPAPTCKLGSARAQSEPRRFLAAAEKRRGGAWRTLDAGGRVPPRRLRRQGSSGQRRARGNAERAGIGSNRLTATSPRPMSRRRSPMERRKKRRSPTASSGAVNDPGQAGRRRSDDQRREKARRQCDKPDCGATTSASFATPADKHDRGALIGAASSDAVAFEIGHADPAAIRSQARLPRELRCRGGIAVSASGPFRSNWPSRKGVVGASAKGWSRRAGLPREPHRNCDGPADAERRARKAMIDDLIGHGWST